MFDGGEKPSKQTSNHAPTSNKAICTDGKEGCGEKKRLEKVYQAKERNATKAEEKLD